MAIKDWKIYKSAIWKYNELEWRNKEGDSLRIEKHRRDIIIWDVMLNHHYLYSVDNKSQALAKAKSFMRKNSRQAIF